CARERMDPTFRLDRIDVW
nr:immunoglobulin heavy chain junction region [Macaca mulatta]MOY21919.1 immunoglobulin heavy chain junction region [Macaca mulatta]MOY23627.1 immunoglobulin heavy chain junction region [Macaca mulatta]MOY23811.1 immunoglobulin heavy chain junction region [Macaca mulatta]MOY24244.1 immunoglobulin heavy chain junction region [Macaca mulatta]